MIVVGPLDAVGKIPIANIYYLLCYAWDHLDQMDTLAEVGALDSTELLDLFAKVLVTGTRRLIRRGLDRGYLSRQDEIAGVRGKLLVSDTLRRDLLRHARTACVWDELEYDTMPNRILKATLRRLHDSDRVDSGNRANIYDLLRWLSPTRDIRLRAEHFRQVQLHRNNRIYSFLLQICRFVYEHWLPDEMGGAFHFRDFVRNGLPHLFEKFIFNFYKNELPAPWQVNSPNFSWQMLSANDDALTLVPGMYTDVCLRCPERAIILDAKFYKEALTDGAHGTTRLPSYNLYQLFTYLIQRSSEPGWKQAEGVLLYPRTTRDFAADFTTYGHRIRALSLDLAQPWRQIHEGLMRIATE